MDKLYSESIERRVLSLQGRKPSKKKMVLISKTLTGHNLLFVGMRHSFPPQKKNIDFIKNAFHTFVRKNGKRTCVVVVEGPTPIQKYKKIKELILEYYESGILIPLAQKEKISLISVEPRLEDLLQYATEKKCKKLHIGVWMFLNFLINVSAKRKIKEDDMATILSFIHQSLQYIKSPKQNINNEYIRRFSLEIRRLTDIKLPSTVDSFIGKRFLYKKRFMTRTAAHSSGCSSHEPKIYELTTV